MFEYIYNEDQKPWRKKKPRQTDESDVGVPPPAPVQTYDFEQMPSDEQKTHWDSEGDILLWPIPQAPPTPTIIQRAAVVNISKAPRYRIPRSAMLLDDPNIEVITYAAGVITGWDTDAERQIPQNASQFSTDDETDTAIEYIIIPPFDPQYSPQPDEQSLWWKPSFEMDTQDEREATNYIILPFNDWTLDSEQQFDCSWHIGDDVADAGIEIIVPPVPIFVLGGGQVIPLLSVSGSSTLELNASGQIQLANVNASSTLVINASGEVELIVVNATLINSGDK